MGDVITTVDDEFVCGMPLKEAMELLSGKASSSVQLTLSRVEARMKIRISFDVIRDFGHTDIDLAKEARKRDDRALKLLEKEGIQAAAEAAYDRILEEKTRNDNLLLQGVLDEEIMVANAFKRTKIKAQRSSAMAPPPGPQSSFEGPMSSCQMPVHIVNVETTSEVAARKPKTYTVETERAEVGIRCSADNRGLVIDGFVRGTSAASSGLMVRDIITQAGEHFLAGMSAVEAFGLLRGDMRSEVDLTVSRFIEGVRTRLVVPVELDVPATPQKADIGIAFKLESAGLRVTDVFSGTSASEELRKNDVITQIDDEFIAGMPSSEVTDLFSGPVRSGVEMVFSRLDAHTKFKKRCSAQVMFDYKPRVADLGEYSPSGDVGIQYTSDALGLKVTGFKKGTSAASSDLQIGDIITEVDDELVVGMPAALAIGKMTGPRDTPIEIAACRKSATGRKTRVAAVILRDVGSVPKIARPGFEVEMESGGLRIVAVVAGTDAVASGLQAEDTIVMINDEFIAGSTAQDAWSQLWGEVGSSISMCACRQEGGIKSRVSASVMRDHSASLQMPSRPPSVILTKIATLPTKLSAFQPVRPNAPRPKRVKVRGGGSRIIVMAVLAAIIAYLVHKCTTMEECSARVQIGAQMMQDVKSSPHVKKAFLHMGQGYSAVVAAGVRVAPVIADRAKEAGKALVDAGSRATPAFTGCVSSLISGAKSTSYVAGTVQRIEEAYATVYTSLSGNGGNAADQDLGKESGKSPGVPAAHDSKAQSTGAGIGMDAPPSSILQGARKQAEETLSAISRGVFTRLSFSNAKEDSPASAKEDSSLGKDAPVKPSNTAPSSGQEPQVPSLIESVTSKAGEALNALQRSLPSWSFARSQQEEPVKEQGVARSVVDDAVHRLEEARKAMVGSEL